METLLNRKLPFRKEFPNTGDDFTGHHAAIQFLTEKGYSFGSMQRKEPIGLVKGTILIAKWHNLDADDKKQLNGVIIFDDGGPREGTAVILLDEMVV